MEDKEHYIKGFNHGYFLKKNEPELAETFSQHLSKNSEYRSGFEAGITEAEKEKTPKKEFLIDKVKKEARKNKSKDKHQDKDKGREMEP